MPLIVVSPLGTSGLSNLYSNKRLHGTRVGDHGFAAHTRVNDKTGRHMRWTHCIHIPCGSACWPCDLEAGSAVPCIKSIGTCTSDTRTYGTAVPPWWRHKGERRLMMMANENLTGLGFDQTFKLARPAFTYPYDRRCCGRER